MTINLLRTAGILGLILVLGACGSTPRSNHYLLSARVGASPSAQTPALGIGPVTVAEYLNRNNLVYRQTDNQLHIAAAERWAEPLPDGITRVLGLNLASLLNTGDVQYFPWHPERVPEYAVQVKVLSLDAGAGQANLVAEWLVRRPGSRETVSRRISRLQQPLAGDKFSPGQLAPAYSELLFQLSEVIAASITAAVAQAQTSVDS